MHLLQLKLHSFKNHKEARFDFEGDLVAFCGPNGAGKTNVLDAIHVLCMCKSYFQNVEANSITHGEAWYSVFGKVKTDGLHEAGCMYERGKAKTFQFDKKPYERLADHIGKMPVVLIAPGDISLIQEGSEERRRFMDMLIAQSDPRYLQELMRYQKALEQRNKQLKRFNESGYVDTLLLDSLDQQLITPAAYLFQTRKAFLADFVPGFLEHYGILSRDAEQVQLHYESDMEGGDMTTLLAGNRENDLYLGRTTLGLHKDDLHFQLDEKPLKKFGSQGQIKSFLIALKLAQFDYLKEKTGVKPLLLLDDIFEKLDEYRTERLIQRVAQEHFGQIFLTDTHRQRVESVFSEIGRKAQIFVLEK